MKSIHLILILISTVVPSLPVSSAEIVPKGVHTTAAEAERYQKDYENVMRAALIEFFETGTVSDHAYRSIAILVGSAETRGYELEPALRVSERENLAQAAIIQLFEGKDLRFDYPSIYTLQLQEERP